MRTATENTSNAMHATPENAEAALEDGFVTPSTTWWMRCRKYSDVSQGVKNPSAWVFDGKQDSGSQFRARDWKPIDWVFDGYLMK
jgi:hypothetical protein